MQYDKYIIDQLSNSSTSGIQNWSLVTFHNHHHKPHSHDKQFQWQIQKKKKSVQALIWKSL